MPVNVLGDGALEFNAQLTVEGFINGTKIMESGLDSVAKKAAESSAVQQDAIDQVSQAQVNNATILKKTGDDVFNAWKTRTEQILKLAKEAGVKAGESFEFSETPISGIESTTFISDTQLKQMQDALTILDNQLSTQQQIANTGLTELEFLTVKQNLLAELGKEMDSQSQERLSQLNAEREAIKTASDERKKAEGTEVIKQRATVSDILGKDFANVLANAKRSFSELDQETQTFINDLVELSLRTSEAESAQKALDDARDAGRISVKQYSQASAELAAEQARILNEIELVTQQQKEFEAINQAGTGGLNQKKIILAQLTKAYGDLSKAQQGTDEGKDMAARISLLKSEIKGMDPAKITQAKTAITSTFTELRKLKDEMARNPNSPFFEQWKTRAAELERSVTGVRNSLKLATSESAGVDALSAGVRGLVGGFTALTGAVGLFTDNTEQAERMSRNAMSALALLNGVQELSNILAREGKLNVYLLSLMRKANTAATAAETTATAINTTVHRAQAVATTQAAVAQRGLTLAMLANPAAAVVIGIAALVGAYLAFRKRTDEVRSAQQLLAKAQKDVSDKMAEAEAKIRPYLDVLKKGNLTEQERLDLYKKFVEIDPKIVAGLDQKTFAYHQLADGANRYLTSLREQFALEANQEAIKESIKLEMKFQDEIEKTQKTIDDVEKRQAGKSDIEKAAAKRGTFGIGAQDVNELNNAKVALAEVNDNLVRQKKVTQELGQTRDVAEKKAKAETEKTIAAIKNQIGILEKQRDSEKTSAVEKIRIAKEIDDNEKQLSKLSATRGIRSIDIIEAEISELKKLQSQQSTTHEQKLFFQSQINAKEKELAKITGDVKKPNFRSENEFNTILDKRKKILDDISSLERDAAQSGLIEEASAVDKINEKYDRQLELIKKTNVEIERFNKRHPKTPTALIGQPEVDRTNAARATEVQNTILKQDAAKFIESVRDKKAAFDSFLKTQEEGNLLLAEKTRELYREQLGDFSSYLQFLQAEATKLLPKILSPFANVGDVEKFKALSKAITEETEAERVRQQEKAVENFEKLLNATVTFNQAKAAINKKYDDLEATLAKDTTLKSKEERQRILATGRAEELQALQNQLIRESDLYKKLNQDIIGFTRQQIKDRIKLLKDQLKVDTTLTPQQKADIQSTISQYEGLLDQTNQVAADFSKLAGQLSGISGIFGNLAGALEGVNDELADSLSMMSQLVDIASNVAGAVAQFASGDILGGIGSVVSAVTGIFNIGKKAKEERRRQQEEVREFLQNIFVGEQEINTLYRERALEQVRMNKLRLEGMKDESKLLEEQKIDIQAQFDVVLTELQKLKARVRKTLFGNVEVFSFESLAGKNFDELEQLFLKGQLEGRAKQLFELLQNLKQQGLDVDAILLQNAETMKQLLTGTTADSITDSIIDGFKNGLNSAADFADTFKELMQNAVLQSLKLKFLEGPLKEFFNEFATLSETDGGLSSGEVAGLQDMFNTIIKNANEQFENLQQIAGLNINSRSGDKNSLVGGIKGMSQQTAELIAGQFGGLRLTVLDQLSVSRASLLVFNDIQVNTGLAAVRLLTLVEKQNAYETGAKYITVKVL